jgi:hypothetical protein
MDAAAWEASEGMASISSAVKSRSTGRVTAPSPNASLPTARSSGQRTARASTWT